MDIVGIPLFADINNLWGEQLEDDAALARANFLKENYVNQNKLGVKANEGFYSYPNPAYKNASFIK